jgi:ferredoxin
MKVRVDLDLCESHGVCEGHAPAVFQVGDDDITRVLLPEPPPEMHDAVRLAQSGCPKQAIFIED